MVNRKVNSMSFQFRPLRIPDVVLIEAQAREDKRGFFHEMYKALAFAANGISTPFVQDNYVRSHCGVIRGLHYNLLPQAQGKLMMVLRGRIFDVAVDIRRGSPTYGQHVGQELFDDDRYMLYIPPGFAHGFGVLSVEADLFYKVTVEYEPELERGILWNDPTIGVKWPIACPILSERDTQLPLLKDAENNFVFGKK